MSENRNSENQLTGPGRSKAVMILLGVITVILIGWALKATFIITMPLVLAFFLATLLRPVQRWLNDRLAPRLHWLSLVAVMGLFVLVLAFGIGAVWISIERVAEKAPQYQEQFQQIFADVRAWAQHHNLPIREDLLKSGGFRNKLLEYVGWGVSSLLNAVALVVLVFFLLLLMLLETHTWRDKSRTAFRWHSAAAIFDTTDAIADQVRRYLTVRTVVSLISGVCAGLWAMVMGVDFALLWGLLTFILNYVPNIGSIISVIPPTLMAVFQFGPGRGAVVLAGLIAIEQVIGNYIDPRLQGRKMSISPVVVLVSVIFWGWIWGTVGALIAVPITATVIIVCAHVPSLRPIALLLSDTGSAEELSRYTHGTGNNPDGL